MFRIIGILILRVDYSRRECIVDTNHVKLCIVSFAILVSQLDLT